ncbi:uncharacterized protein LOC121021218 isoform X6 [Herpailurus yagouaroundi]|uniref:uncharacterized protein LOC121021218 isoform X6 n=1 Tax=Herpailurus yagouaroundi TaxID=1608482 RepID=UPI001AD6F8AE|nr:uncharacterized protein LOC121021218 isoform X6 [Puma yagouaroundi]
MVQVTSGSGDGARRALVGPHVHFLRSQRPKGNVFRLIPGRRRMGESRSTEGRPLQGQRESLPSSQDGRRVVPQGMLLETEQCSERDCPPDACRVPEVARMVYPKAQLLQPARADVLVMTPWFAPVIWDGVFDSAILDAQFENTTVGLTIFAIRK